MPQPHSAAQTSASEQHRKEKRAELIYKVRFNNTLPDIPFEPKFLDYPIDTQRFVQYTVTSLEKDHKHELYGEFDGGLSVELIGLDADVKRTVVAGAKPEDPLDQLLLEDDDESAKLKEAAARSTRHRGTVSWLRKTEYVSAENVNRSFQVEKVESRVGYGVKRTADDEILYKDKDSQITAIRRTFERAKEPIAHHYSKQGIEPVEILPVLPNFTMWPYACAQVIFDSDPARTVVPDKAIVIPGADTVDKDEANIAAQSAEAARRASRRQLDEMSTAMIRGMQDEQGEQFVGYFLPTDPTRRRLTHRRRAKRRALYGDLRAAKRNLLRRRSTSASNAEELDFHTLDSESEDDADDEHTDDADAGEVNEYGLAREYNWTVKNRVAHGYEENYFFVFTPQGVVYTDIDTKVRLSKRRRVAAGPNEQQVSAVQLERQRAKTRLLVSLREETEEEKQLGVSRTRRMFGLPDEDEEDEDANETAPQRDAGDATPQHDSASEKQDSDEEIVQRAAVESDSDQRDSDASESPKKLVDSDEDLDEPPVRSTVDTRRETANAKKHSRDDDDNVSLSLSSSSSSIGAPRETAKRKSDAASAKKQPKGRQRAARGSRNAAKKPAAKKRHGDRDSISSSSLSLSESD